MRKKANEMCKKVRKVDNEVVSRKKILSETLKIIIKLDKSIQETLGNSTGILFYQTVKPEFEEFPVNYCIKAISNTQVK